MLDMRKKWKSVVGNFKNIVG